MIFATEMQHKLLASNKEVTILANSSGSGQTYGLVLKALHSSATNISLFTSTYKQSQGVVDLVKTILHKEGIPFRFSRTSGIFTIDNGYISKKLKVIPKGSFTSHVTDLILVDNVHQFEQRWVTDLCATDFSHIPKVFATQPLHCGWRNFEWDHGLPLTNDKDNLLLSDTSWDYNLIDWKDTKTRAEVSDYKDNVNVITGYGINPYLVEDNPVYVSCINTLNPADKLRVQGEWIEGKKVV